MALRKRLLRLEQAVTPIATPFRNISASRPTPISRLGEESMGLNLLAKRTSDAATAQMSMRQIDLALRTVRDGGDARLAAHHKAELPKARARFD